MPWCDKDEQEGLFRKDDTIVCPLTGHGVKDQENAIRILAKTHDSTGKIE